MKLTINGVSVSIDKEIVKEIVVNGSEFTIINETKNFVNDDNDSIINKKSKKNARVSKYTIDNPKLVKLYDDFKGMETFTGVVKDKYDDIAHYVDGKLHRVDGPVKS